MRVSCVCVCVSVCICALESGRKVIVIKIAVSMCQHSVTAAEVMTEGNDLQKEA